MMPLYYCVGVKADIHKCHTHADAYGVRFHSRDNRIKGDPADGHPVCRRQRFDVWRMLGMVSRALSLATVTLLIGCFTAGVVAAENLDAGKSPSQIFSSTCSACHKSPRGLLKSTPASSLPGFLRQHYTTGTDMASVLSSYLISNGAADPRYQGKDQAKQKDARQRDARPDSRPDVRSDQPERSGRRPPPAAEASRPDAESAAPQGEGTRRGRDSKRFSRRHTAPEAGPADEQAPVQAATDSKTGTRHKHGKRARPIAEEAPKADQAARGDAAKEKEDVSQEAAKPEAVRSEPGKTELGKTELGKTESATPDPARSDALKDEGDKPSGEAAKPVGESSREVRSDTAKVDGSRESTGSEPAPLRPDPVTPAAPTATTAPEPSSAPAPVAPPTSTATAPAASSEAPASPSSR
ncbi:hypothetical protein [Bradyrhizobium sp.]|uniref:hypothetical protein n=1 Tax=Bradyrhizobium sp. TaxID=376 RepID=UPI002D1FBE91|nr:hypothetical protein [Bradyrhizobium sp.]